MTVKQAHASQAARFVWWNGEVRSAAGAHVPLAAMGASGSLAVFEGVKAYRSDAGQNLYVICLHEHMRRLYESMKVVRMAPAYSQAEMEAAVLSLLRANDAREDTSVRPVAFYDGIKQPSFRLTVGEAPDLSITTSAFTSHLLRHQAKTCAISSWTRVSDNQSPPRVKCMSNYQNNRLAYMQAALDGYDEAILLDDRGKVTEAAGSCLFVVRRGTILTAPVTGGILESITREVVIHLCREVLGLPVLEREIDRTELYVAEEAFLAGTGEEITAVTQVDRLNLGSGAPGPIFLALEALYHDLVRGRDERYPEWRAAVY